VLIQTQAVTEVLTAEQQTSAVAAIRSLKELLAEAEDARKEVKAPVLALSRKIDGLADAAKEMLSIEKFRLERLLVAFEQAEQRRVEREELRREEAAAKAQALATALCATLHVAEAKIKTEQDLLNAIAAEEAAKAAVEAERQAALVPVAESNKAKGTIVRREVAWKCIDVHALYQARPELVRVEPNAAAIRSVCFPEMPVPGLKLWWETKVTARKA